jgi:hypothetical protein
VSAQIRRDDAKAAGQPLLGELPEPAAVALDAVEADDGWGAGVAPLVDVERGQRSSSGGS